MALPEFSQKTKIYRVLRPFGIQGILLKVNADIDIDGFLKAGAITERNIKLLYEQRFIQPKE
jgi:hypothetical protein